MGGAASVDTVSNRISLGQQLADLLREWSEEPVGQLGTHGADMSVSGSCFAKFGADPHKLLQVLANGADKRLLSTWRAVCHDIVSSNQFLVSDCSDGQQLVMDTGDTTALKKTIAAQKADDSLCVVAESLELEELSWLLDAFTQGRPNIIALNVQSNQLTPSSLCDAHISSSTSLVQLQMGGNHISNMLDITPLLPSSLLVLDLSFTEGLLLPPGAFLFCPQLLQLTLDGCGLTTTVIEDEDLQALDGTIAGISDAHKQEIGLNSVFFGLISLINLSLKENNIETAEGFHGLQFFSAQLSAHASSAHVDKTNALPARQLTNLSVAENPLFESSAALKTFTKWIQTTLPTVRTLDSRPLQTAAQGTVDHTSAQFRAQRNQQATISGTGVSDAMEREFTAALKGEKDVSIVS